MPIQDVLLLFNVSHGGVISSNGSGTTRANGGGSGYSQYIPTIRVGLPAETFESASLGSVPHENHGSVTVRTMLLFRNV